MYSRASRVAALALSLILVSCTSQPAPGPSPTPSATVAPTSLHLLEADDVQTVDPALVDDPVSLSVGNELFEGLTRLDASNRPAPALAESWEIGNSGRTYTFHLRAAHYQSGAEVQAQDALTAWARALAPGTASPLTGFFAPLGARYTGDPLTTVEVLDGRTLRMNLAKPDSELLTLLSLPPYWLYDPKAVTATFGNEPVAAGSGPYRLERWDRGRRLSLRAFDGYWGARPPIRTVDIEIVPDPATRLERFGSGAVDVVHGLTGPQVLAFARDPQHAAMLHRVPTPRTTWLGFNTVAGPSFGAAPRMALAGAIDRARLTDLALYGSMLGSPATDLLPPSLPGHLDRALPSYDPAAARRALDQAGLPAQIDLYFSTGVTVGRVARELQDQLQEATGRTVVLHPTCDFFKQASLDHFPLLIDTWSADVPYPADILENVLRGGAQFNNLHLEDTRVDGALDAARSALNFEEAMKAYQRAEEIVLSDVRLIPLYFGVEPYLVRPGLQGGFTGGILPYRWQDVR